MMMMDKDIVDSLGEMTETQQKFLFDQALSMGREKILKSLITKNSRLLEMKDGDGRTPLYRACQHGYSAVVRMLLANGADATLVDKHGMTAFEYIFNEREPNRSIIRTFVNNGLNLDSRWNKFPPLMYAILADWNEIVEALLDRGVDINEQDPILGTALNLAIKNGKILGITQLMNRGARLRPASPEQASTMPVNHNSRMIIPLAQPAQKSTVPGTLANVLDYATVYFIDVTHLIPKAENAHELLQMKHLDRFVSRYGLPTDMGDSLQSKLAFYATVTACRLERAKPSEGQSFVVKSRKARLLREAIRTEDPSAMFHALHRSEIQTHFWQQNNSVPAFPESLLKYERELAFVNRKTCCGIIKRFD